MSEQPKDGGSAFPVSKPLFMVESDGNGQSMLVQGTDKIIQGGMSLRDYFAGQALVAVLRNGDFAGAAAYPQSDSQGIRDAAAFSAYAVADAMLKARENV